MRLVAAYRALVFLSALGGIVLLLVDNGGDLSAFVYFTVQSNAVVAIVFALAVAGRVSVRLRGAATLYIVITGTVYHLVLANPASPFHTADPGAHTMHNLLLHTVTPLLVLVDWLVVSTELVRWFYAGAWLAYPLAYAAFALVRGAIVHEYPYPFIDADKLGYGGVSVSVVVFAAVFFLLGLAVIGLGALARRGRMALIPAPADPA
jgi:hypothetical protein